MKLSKKVLKTLENNGFDVGAVGQLGKDYCVEISQYTPLGEDWHETFWFDGTNRGFFEAIRVRATGFDVDEEIEPFIENRGKYGVPSSISALVMDSEWKKETLTELACQLGALNL